MMSAAVSRLGHIYDSGEQKWAQHARRDYAKTAALRSLPS